MGKRTKSASVEDLDTFIIDWTNMCLYTLKIHQACGFPPVNEGDKTVLQDLLNDLEDAGIVDSLIAEKMEHIIRYRNKFSYTEPMDHYELMDMLELIRALVFDDLSRHPALDV